MWDKSNPKQKKKKQQQQPKKKKKKKKKKIKRKWHGEEGYQLGENLGITLYIDFSGILGFQVK